MDMGDGAKLAAVLVGGPVLGGLLVAGMSESVVEREPPPPQVALDASDTSARCATHGELASVGTCPRCGTFVCRECAGPQLANGCARCQASPALRAQRVRAAARRVAVAGYAMVALVIVSVLIGLDTAESLRVVLLGTGAIVLPIFAFSTVQLGVRHPWPGIVATLWSLGMLVLLLIAGGGGNVFTCGWLLCLGAQFALLRALFNARKSAS
jgi:hypothetical protein